MPASGSHRARRAFTPNLCALPATHVYDLKEGRFSDALADLLNAGYVCVGSPTRNNTMLPNVAYFLCDMKGLFGKNDRKALAFGSYGWAPTGPKEVNAQLEAIGYETLMEPITMNWVPTDADLRKITDDVAAAVQTA